MENVVWEKDGEPAGATERPGAVASSQHGCAAVEAPAASETLTSRNKEENL